MHYPKKVAPKCKQFYRQEKSRKKREKREKKQTKISVQIRSDSATICIIQKKLLPNANNSTDRKKAEKSTRNAKKSKLRNKCANSERQRHYALSKKSCSQMQTILQTKEKSRKREKKKEMYKFREMVPPCSFYKKKKKVARKILN